MENDATDEFIVNAHQVDPGLREDMVLMAMVSKGVNNAPRRKPREVPKRSSCRFEATQSGCRINRIRGVNGLC